MSSLLDLGTGSQSERASTRSIGRSRSFVHRLSRRRLTRPAPAPAGPLNAGGNMAKWNPWFTVTVSWNKILLGALHPSPFKKKNMAKWGLASARPVYSVPRRTEDSLNMETDLNASLPGPSTRRSRSGATVIFHSICVPCCARSDAATAWPRRVVA
jgi:hypothetical protein